MEQILVYNDLLPQEEFLKIGPFLRKHGYSFSHSSQPNENKFFWTRRLTDQALFMEQIPAILKQRINQDFSIIRVYTNGLTYGLDSSFHTDNGNNATHTILWYVHEGWDKEWGGQTEFIVDNKHYYTYPTPNQFILFPAHLLHKGHAPTRSCPYLRQIVAWKIIMKPTA